MPYCAFFPSDKTYLANGVTDGAVWVLEEDPGRMFPLPQTNLELDDPIPPLREFIASQFGEERAEEAVIWEVVIKAGRVLPYWPKAGRAALRDAHYKTLPAPMKSALSGRCYGTTTSAADVGILYFGEHLVCFRNRGSNYSDNGGSHYCPGNVVLCSKHNLRFTGSGHLKVDKQIELHDDEHGRFKQAICLSCWDRARMSDQTYLEREKEEQQQVDAYRAHVESIQAEQREQYAAIKEAAEAKGAVVNCDEKRNLASRYSMQGDNRVETNLWIKIGPFKLSLRALWRDADPDAYEGFRVIDAKVELEALPSVDPINLINNIPALPFVNGGAS